MAALSKNVTKIPPSVSLPCVVLTQGLKKRREGLERESNRKTHTHTERENKREGGGGEKCVCACLQMTDYMCVPSSLWRTAGL